VIKFRGRGGHGAAPQETIHPVMIAARFIVDVQGVISRENEGRQLPAEVVEGRASPKGNSR
jgi:metal-dependent amidase/aminoacylase/carboxypeptidase family protein